MCFKDPKNHPYNNSPEILNWVYVITIITRLELPIANSNSKSREGKGFVNNSSTDFAKCNISNIYYIITFEVFFVPNVL